TLSGLLVERTASTAVRQSEMLPADFALGIYPNPFNPSAKITYSLATPGTVELTLFDMNGRQIQTLVREFRPAGSQQILLDSRGLSAGIYFVRLQFEGKLLAQRKAVYLK
ncbi:T9SS type A sorting domain-containing protein, partial [candidate division KSB1 bacterium]|nr:T9SS type A sorting domain-containing protein [candidate division KSB1 bacterium]